MLYIRRANLDDVETLIQLRLDLLREVGSLIGDHDLKGLVEATQEYMLNTIPRGIFVVWVAEGDNYIVATSRLIFLERPPTSKNLVGLEAYVMNMYTKPQWRRRGVATALIKEIIRFVKETDAKYIRLHASEDGRPIYEKNGFIPTANEMVLAL